MQPAERAHSLPNRSPGYPATACYNTHTTRSIHSWNSFSQSVALGLRHVSGQRLNHLKHPTSPINRLAHIAAARGQNDVAQPTSSI